MTDSPARRRGQQSAGKKKHFLLLVDGNAKDLFSTGMILQRFDYDIYIANTAEDALQIINAALPTLVITDVMLPGMSGIDFIKRLKRESRTKALPVVVQSSATDSKTEDLCLSIGCASYLKKPVGPDTLYRAVQHAFETTPRNYIRLKKFLMVAVDDQAPSNGAVGAEFVTALSENGIYVQTTSPRPLKTVHPVTIMIDDKPVKARAVVLYRNTTAGKPFKEPGMGMRFVEIANADRALIRNFIKEQLTEDIVSPE